MTLKNNQKLLDLVEKICVIAHDNRDYGIRTLAENAIEEIKTSSSEEDRFAKVLAAFHEYMLDLDHDMEGCGPGELDVIDHHREAALELRRRVVAHVAEDADARGQRPGEEPALFYIQDSRTYVGDTVVWWRPDGKGYTTKLGEAGLYTEKEARSLRDTDKMIPVEIARKSARITVQIDDLSATFLTNKEERRWLTRL